MDLRTPLYQLSLPFSNLWPSLRDAILSFSFTFYYFILYRWRIPQNIRCSFKLVTVPQIYSILCFTHSFGLLVTAACPPPPPPIDNG